jgi:hypothetical protein
VENFDFFHKISDLRHFLLAGQSLYLARTKLEQKIGKRPGCSFFTSHPVDIHQVFHSRARFFTLKPPFSYLIYKFCPQSGCCASFTLVRVLALHSFSKSKRSEGTAKKTASRNAVFRPGCGGPGQEQ